MNEQPLPTPGWYPDPEQAATQRYWDGSGWTEQRAPLSAGATSADTEAIAGVIVGIAGILILLVVLFLVVL